MPLPTEDMATAGPDELTGRERATDVANALAGLPIEQAAALVLVDALGYPVEEAARILEAPTGTVKSRCARGRARLAIALDHWAPEGNRAAVGRVGLKSTSQLATSNEEVQP